MTAVGGVAQDDDWLWRRHAERSEASQRDPSPVQMTGVGDTVQDDEDWGCGSDDEWWRGQDDAGGCDWIAI